MSIASEDLSDHVYRQIQPFCNLDKTENILIGYSGGLDSTVLLHIVVGLASKLNSITIEPIHINHGVNPAAKQWIKHCRSFCEKLNLSLTVDNFSLQQIKSNREAVYRRTRYKAFANHLQENDVLLTAHHQQDLAETVLFNLFRGAGVSGLRGMKAVRQFSCGYHLRPLLSVSRRCLSEYARHYKLSWIEDPSNQDLDFDRNYIRHKILPLINKRWPASLKSISRTAELLNQIEIILNELAEQDLVSAQAIRFPGVINGLYLSVLDIDAVLNLSEQRQINLLKNWIRSHASLLVSSEQLAQIHQTLCQKSDSSGLFELNNIQLRAFNGYLYLMEKLPQAGVAEFKYTTVKESILFEQLGLRLEIKTGKYPARLQFKPRHGGETIHQNSQTKSLKTIYQQKSIPPWERKLIPLVYVDDVLVAVPGVVYADGSVIQNCRLSKYVSQNV